MLETEYVVKFPRPICLNYQNIILDTLHYGDTIKIIKSHYEKDYIVYEISKDGVNGFIFKGDRFIEIPSASGKAVKVK